eukprot:8456350-Prorocentrum_lima.AAC.1
MVALPQEVEGQRMRLRGPREEDLVVNGVAPGVFLAEVGRHLVKYWRKNVPARCPVCQGTLEQEGCA